MRILVVLDEYGNIKSAAVPAAKLNLRAGLRPQRGEFVTEVEAPGLELEDLRSNPREIAENFRIDTICARLLRKNPLDRS